MEGLTYHEATLLLTVLKHYLPLDLRSKLMAEVPHAYNSWVGREVMSTVRIEDGRDYPNPKKVEG